MIGILMRFIAKSEPQTILCAVSPVILPGGRNGAKQMVLPSPVLGAAGGMRFTGDATGGERQDAERVSAV